MNSSSLWGFFPYSSIIILYVAYIFCHTISSPKYVKLLPQRLLIFSCAIWDSPLYAFSTALQLFLVSADLDQSDGFAGCICKSFPYPLWAQPCVAAHRQEWEHECSSCPHALPVQSFWDRAGRLASPHAMAGYTLCTTGWESARGIHFCLSS